MAVEWTGTERDASAEIGDMLTLHVAVEIGEISASIIGADSQIWYVEGFDTLAAAKSAALAEARRLLAQAMEELGDG